MAQRLGIERLAYWAHQFGFGAKSGIDLPGEVAGHRPDQPVEAGHASARRSSRARSSRPASARATTRPRRSRSSTPTRRWPTAARSTSRRSSGESSTRTAPSCGHSSRSSSARSRRRRRNFEIMRLGAREVVTSRHTFNLVELPIVVAGKTGTAEFGVRDCEGPAAVPHLVRRVRAEAPRTSAKPDSQLAVIGFAYDSNTVGNAATEIVKYFLQLHYNLEARPAPVRTFSGAATSTVATDGRPEGRAGQGAATGPPVGRGRLARVRLQLTIYAVLLIGIGLAMAYTQQHRGRRRRRSRLGSTFTRGLHVAAIAIAAFTLAAAFDYRWLRTLRLADLLRNLGLLVLTLADRRRGQRRGALGLDRAVLPVPVQRARQDPDDRGAGELPGQPAEEPELDLDDPRRLRPDRCRPGCSCCSSRTSGRRSCSPRSWPGCCSCPERALRWLAVLAAAIIAAVPIAWTYILRDYQKQRLLQLPRPGGRPAGLGLSAAPERRSRSVPADCSARA